MPDWAVLCLEPLIISSLEEGRAGRIAVPRWIARGLPCGVAAHRQLVFIIAQHIDY